MSGWSDEGAGDPRGRAGTAGERPQKPLPPGWSVRPKGMRQRPARGVDVGDVRPREQRPQRPPRDPGDGGGRPRTARRPRRWGRRIGVTLLVLAVLLVGAAVWVDSRLNRVDALPDYQGRPAATPGADWLIVGSDSREGLDEGRRRQLGTGQAAGRRADTMMLLHIPRGTG